MAAMFRGTICQFQPAAFHASSATLHAVFDSVQMSGDRSIGSRGCFQQPKKVFDLLQAAIGAHGLDRSNQARFEAAPINEGLKRCRHGVPLAQPRPQGSGLLKPGAPSFHPARAGSAAS
jgi:hypothetical protein